MNRHKLYTKNLFFCSLIILGGVHIAECQSIYFNPVPLINIGNEFIITCNYPESVINLKFTNPSGNVFFKNHSDVSLYHEGSLTLTIRNATLSSGGAYKCSGRNTTSGIEVQTITSVSVIDPLRLVNPQPVQDFELGETAEVVCETAGSPKGNIVWLIGKDTISKKSSDRIFMNQNTSNLIIKQIKITDEAVYTCSAFELINSQAKRLEIRVRVQITPRNVEINGKNRIVQSQSSSLVCSSVAKPPAVYEWYYSKKNNGNNKTLIGDGVGKNGTLFLDNITQAQTGRYTCVAKNVRGEASNGTFVTVIVPPRIFAGEFAPVKIGSQVRLSCSASGYPRPTLSVYRHSKPLKRNVTKSILNTTTIELVFILSNVTPNNAGDYFCKASNEAGSTASSVLLNVRYPPRITSSIRSVSQCMNKEAVLTCTYDSYPPAAVMWSIVVPSKSLNETNTTAAAYQRNGGNPTYEYEPVTEGGGFTTVTEDGKSSLHVNISSESKYTSYLCKVRNDEGSDQIEVNLNEPSLPSKPKIKKIKKITNSTVMFGFSHSNQQVPILSYNILLFDSKDFEDTKSFMSNETTSKFKHDSMLWYTMTDLKPNKKYVFALSSVNCKGESDESSPRDFTTKANKPSMITVTSNTTSASPNSYNLTWDLSDSEASIVLQLAISISKTENKVEEVVHFEILDQNDAAFIKRMLAIEGLSPSTSYQVSLDSSNKAGNVLSHFSFTTAEADDLLITPTPNIKTLQSSTRSNETTDINKSGYNDRLVRILIAVFVTVIVVFIFIDLIFAICYKCGLFYCLYVNCCASSFASNNLEKSAEEGLTTNKNGDNIDETALLSSNEPSPTSDCKKSMREKEQIQMEKLEKQPLA